MVSGPADTVVPPSPAARPRRHDAWQPPVAPRPPAFTPRAACRGLEPMEAVPAETRQPPDARGRAKKFGGQHAKLCTAKLVSRPPHLNREGAAARVRRTE